MSKDLSKDLSISMLMDFYAQLLTEKQRVMLDLYYNQDYSLSEIAEYADITRQGVRDSIKRGEKQLTELENTLGLAGRFSDICSEFEKLELLIGDIKNRANDENIKKDIEKLEELCTQIKKNL